MKRLKIHKKCVVNYWVELEKCLHALKLYKLPANPAKFKNVVMAVKKRHKWVQHSILEFPTFCRYLYWMLLRGMGKASNVILPGFCAGCY